MKTELVKGTLLTGMFLVMLAACTTTPRENRLNERLTEMGLQPVQEDVSIPPYRVNGWNRIDDRFLVITAGVNDHYLVELATPCFGLESAFRIGFSTPTMRLDRFGSIIVRSFDRRIERCRIDKITRLGPASE